jgi:uncharacterized protein
MHLDLTELGETFAVCRLPAESAVPDWAAGVFRSVSWSRDETSVVCADRSVPADVPADRGWRALVVRGPLAFGLVGVIESIARPLADAGISLFAVSTFDTDYVLVKQEAIGAAVRAIEDAGHRVTRALPGAPSPTS